jgi:glycosyltransferase involved in cell wall biosynthesis
MRILYHHRTQADDAQGVHIYEMRNAFREQGHEVEILALVQLDEKGRNKVRGGYWGGMAKLIPRWTYELMSLVYNIYGYLSLRKAILRKRPDVIYERYALNTFCGIWASRRFGIPLLLEVNAPLCYEQARLGQLVFKGLARRAERWICSNSTGTIVVSHVMKGFLTANGVSGKNISVIPNAIDPSKFSPSVSGALVRRKYGLGDQLVIGFVGWFRKWHGLEMLLDIMRDAELAQRPVRLLLVGDGPAYGDLYRFTVEHNMLPKVVFTGPIDRERVPEHIAAMDIAVQPSVTEYACPIKIIEYMSMAKCIVAPDQPNIREILQDGTNSMLFKPRDPGQLKAALRKAIEDDTRRRGYGSNAYETLLKRGYLWSVNATRALNLITKSAAEVGSLPHENQGSTESRPGRLLNSGSIQVRNTSSEG